jgi:hypothetical protein
MKKKIKKTCKHSNCNYPVYAKGLCAKHYSQQPKTKVSSGDRKTKQRISVKELEKDLDAIFSWVIRMEAADDNGIAQCVTSGKLEHWTKLQNGHYISRKHKSLRFNEKNCHPQTMHDNVFLKGNYPSYALFMIKTYGLEFVEWLKSAKHQQSKYHPFELTVLIKDYLERFKVQAKRLNHVLSPIQKKLIEKYK